MLKENIKHHVYRDNLRVGGSEDEEGGATKSVEEWKPVPTRTTKFKAEIFSIDRPGEACAVSEVKGWEKVRVQVDYLLYWG